MKKFDTLYRILLLTVSFFFLSQLRAQTGQAADLDGINDDIVIDYHDGANLNAYTIQVRVLFKGSTANQGVILWTYDGAYRSWSHQIRTDAAGHFEHALYDQGDANNAAKGVQVIGTTVAMPNRWYNVSITATNYGLVHLYVDGAEEGTPQPVNVLWKNGTGFYVGSYGGNSSTANSQVDYLNGQVDEVRIWNRDIGAAAINQYNNCSLTGHYEGLLRAYNFNQGIADGDNRNSPFISDASGNGSNAFFENAALMGATSNFVTPAGTLTNYCSLPSISITGLNNAIHNGDTTASADNNTDFGTVQIGSQAIKTYTIKNTGTTDLHITGATLGGADATAYNIETTPALLLAPGDVTGFSVKFSPNAFGMKKATLNIASDAFGTAQFSFAISGTGSSVLPLQLTNFTATAKQKTTHLQWTTTNEKHTAYFDVERSIDGRNFAAINRVKASVNTNGETTYNAEDATLGSGIIYYRLKMVDEDGLFTYSPIISVSTATASKPFVNIAPNPITTAATVWLSAEGSQRGTLRLYNSVGQPVKQFDLSFSNGQAQVNITHNGLVAGTYFYELTTEKGERVNGKLLLQ